LRKWEESDYEASLKKEGDNKRIRRKRGRYPLQRIFKEGRGKEKMQKKGGEKIKETNRKVSIPRRVFWSDSAKGSLSWRSKGAGLLPFQKGGERGTYCIREGGVSVCIKGIYFPRKKEKVDR